MEKEKLIKVFTGTESEVILLKSRLEDKGIECIIKNDSSDAFLGTSPQVVDLYINNENFENAKAVIRSITKKD
jgi:spore coat polysaccharide biosynthesis protein SpsF (cytidylyltransferase family)